MSISIVNSIVRQRELKNERIVAIVRSILALTGFWEILAFMKIVPPTSASPNLITSLISVYLLVYALIILVITFRGIYLKYLKYFVIFFDYLYIGVSFMLDKALIANPSIIVWLVFAGAIVFYMINLLRYSPSSTIFAAVLSYFLFIMVNMYYRIPVADILQVGIALSILMLIGFLITSSNLKMLVEVNTKKMMERYLPPQLIGEMYKKNISLEPGGRNQVVTILFSDIRFFTTISEAMSAKEVVAFLNDYLSEMTDVIFEKAGTIDKFIGDAIMTIFGAPVCHDDDARRAVLTAIEMNKALLRLNRKYPGLKFPIKIGTGINTGEVIVGNIGSEKRMDFTVIGDNVNLASRMEGLTKHYGCPILITDSTYQIVKNSLENEKYFIREIDNVVVMGKTSSVKIYEVLPFDNDEEKKSYAQLISQFDQALCFYRARDFISAKIIFDSMNTDKPSVIYSERCTQLITDPPPLNWNGIYSMTAKS